MSAWISRHKRGLTALLILAAAGGVFFGYRSVVVGHTTSSVRYVTQTVSKQTLVSSVSGTGNMVLQDTYSIQSPVSGTVEKVPVRLGDAVKKGQTLFVVSADQINDDLASALSAYNQAEAGVLQAKGSKLQAAQKLDDLEAQVDEGKDVSDTDLTVAEDSLAAARLSYAAALRQQEAALAEYEDAKALLTKRVVTAPHAGVLTTLSVAAGDTVSGSSSTSSSSGGSGATGSAAGSSASGSSSAAASTASSGSASALVVLSDLGSQRADITLNETDIASVKVGQKATLTFDAISDLTLTGKVERIGTTGTNSSGVVSYDVILKPDVLEVRVRPGMTVSASVITHVSPDVLTVPIAAVKMGTDGTSSVQVLVNGSPQTKTVQTGASDDASIEVSSGVALGDKVVTQTIDPNKSTTTTIRGSTGRSNGGLNMLNGGGASGPPVGGPPAGGLGQ